MALKLPSRKQQFCVPWKKKQEKSCCYWSMKATQFHRTITGVSLDKQDAVCSCLSLVLLVRIGRKKEVGVVAGENQMLILLFLLQNSRVN